MSKVNSNDKGGRGERELSKELTRLFGVGCRRGQQYSGIEGRDVVGLDGIHIESKRCEKLSVYAAMAQAKRDAAEDDIPVVFHRRNHKPWLAIVELDQLPALANKLFLTMAEEA